MTQLLIIFLIALVVFGSKRFSSLGEDLGASLKNFRRAMNKPDSKP